MNTYMQQMFRDLLDNDITTISGASSSSGDNELVATPGAGKRIVVTAFAIVIEAAAETTMQLRSGTTSNAYRYTGDSKGEGLAMSFPAGHGWQLNANEALNFNLSGANQCGYSVSYYTEGV